MNVHFKKENESCNLLPELQLPQEEQEDATELKYFPKEVLEKSSRLREKFQGAFLGYLIGDCIVSLFSRDYKVSPEALVKIYNSLVSEELSYSNQTKILEENEEEDDDGVFHEDLASKRNSDVQISERTSVISTISDTRRLSTPLTPTRQSIKSLTKVRTISSGRKPTEKYSGDTVMMLSVAKSLVKCKSVDAKDMSKVLTEDYFDNIRRKFGVFSRNIFIQLRKTNFSDPYGPSRKVSSGKNPYSIGNESASRVAPISLLYWKFSCSSLIDAIIKMTKITNHHKLGVNGAILQGLSVHLSFNWEIYLIQDELKMAKALNSLSSQPQSPLPSSTDTSSDRSSRSSSFSNHLSQVGNRTSLTLQRLKRASFQKRDSITETETKVLEHLITTRQAQPCNIEKFLEKLLSKMSLVENRGSSILENLRSFISTAHHFPTSGYRDLLQKPLEFGSSYTEKLQIISEFLQRSQLPSSVEVIEKLGNSTRAIESVPSALYCFLAASQNEIIPELELKISSPVLRSIFYAISLGGNGTNTLASMTGVMSGAFWGVNEIPQEIIRVCEGYKEVCQLSDKLFDMCTINLPTTV